MNKEVVLQYKNILVVFLTLCVQLSLFAQKRTYQLPRGLAKAAYAPSIIIVKTKNGKGTDLNSRGYKNYSSAIPHIENKSAKHPLASIYKVEIQSDNLIDEINKLLEDENVIYAEPLFYHQPLFTPNDPEANPTNGLQDYLNLIKAYDAWSLEKGDSTIVMGILDSGVDIEHPELIEQVAYNFNDPINGIDDDGDGLIDNYQGWDLADNDNIPLSDNDPHGTQVAGISSARVNNGAGLAGLGFRSKFLPIKIFTSSGNQFANGYEAIALAADLGCDVLNLSWGSPNSFSQFGQDVINYAVLEKDVVIVAAAGNTDEQLDFYPASFDNVLSVSATDVNDNKTFFATYSYSVDLVAPGINIFSTNNNGGYINGTSGTSFSSPMVAGAAALVRARYPNLNAQQVMQKMCVSSDDIYDIGDNTNYEGLLGRGRLNMLDALADNSSPALRITSMDFSSENGEYVYRDDTLTIDIQVTNYLAQTIDANALLTSNSPYVTILHGEFQIGTLPTMGSTSNKDKRFQVVLSQELPTDEELVFRVDFTDGLYEDFEYFTITSSPNFIHLDGFPLSMTISGDGDLGYDEDGFINGEGITLYTGEKILDNIGLLISSDENVVSDNAPTNLDINSRDQDFSPLTPLQIYNTEVADDVLNPNEFTEASSSFMIGDSVLIEQKLVSSRFYDFQLLEYRITNLSSNSMNNLKLSLFADWDIENKELNSAGWDNENTLGYVYNENNVAGIALLTAQSPIYSAINNKNFNGNSADIPININDSVKYYHTSNGILKTSAGEVNGGNDVSYFIGGELGPLAPNNSEKIAFLFSSKNTLPALQSQVQFANDFYEVYKSSPKTIHISEVCLNESAVINPSAGTQYEFYEDDQLSNLLFTGEAFTTPPITMPTTYYVVNKDMPFDSDIFRVIARPKELQAGFSSKPEILLLDETGNTSVQFIDQSVDAVSWNWEFDNGFSSNLKNPLMNFNEVGTYSISLDVISDIGCSESIAQQFQVANRSLLPDLPSEINLCKNDEITLEASNATQLEFFTDMELSNLIFKGASYTTSFTTDTLLYVISTDSIFQSNVREVFINIDNVNADFSYQPDTLDLSSSNLIALSSEATGNVLNIWHVNGELASTMESFTYDYGSTNELHISLTAESITGCTDIAESTIIPEISQGINSEEMVICAGENVIIDPPGEFLHYYADQSLTNLIGKGGHLNLGDVENDTTIYVVNNESLIESEPANYFINVDAIEAIIASEMPSLNLNEENNLQFFDIGTGADSWIWQVNSDTVSLEQNPRLSFSDIGIYNIHLAISNDTGCNNEDETTFEVVSITSIDEIEGVVIYPNPTDGFIEFSQSLKDIKLYDQQGQNVASFSESTNEIDLQNFPVGIYILEATLNGKSQKWKIILE